MDDCGDGSLTLSQYSSVGQDFSFTAYGQTFEDLKENVYQYSQDYDVDYEASLWIGADGHGSNGAPYHISDILADMQDCQSMMEDLYYALQDAQQ